MKNDAPGKLAGRENISLRHGAKFLLLANPNYFGNLDGLDLPGLPGSVVNIVGDTGFEELTCVGYNPQSRLLTAIVQVKLGAGYGGGPCTDGSQEHVRFYLDYGDGVWVDHGVVGFTAHDIGVKDHLCYAVSIPLKSLHKRCCGDKPVLPRVRAILSWNFAPPPNAPDWLPVWGNRLERDIQIEPRNSFLCHVLDKIDLAGIQLLNPALVAKLKAIADSPLDLPDPPEPVEKLLSAEMVKADMMGSFRNLYAGLAGQSTETAMMTMSAQAPWLKEIGFDLPGFADFLVTPKFNTTYEELHCVGLDRDASALHGIIQIKQPNGFSGGLCKKGSQEHVAFFLDFGSGWEFQGVSSVAVHDVPVPAGGLWYQVQLPVKLDAHRQEWCKTGIARIRGVLSWEVMPTTDPEFIPPWGDREDCHVEIRPLPEGVTPGVFTPFLASIGNMAVTKINAAGYANGLAEGSAFTAHDAPFGGQTLLKGEVFGLPGGPLEYRVMIKGPSDLTYRAWNAPFTADVTTFPSVFSVQQLISASGDWFPYIEADPNKKVAGDLLGALYGLEDGIHSLYLEFRQPLGPVLATTTPKAFMVDNTGPAADVEIDKPALPGGGNCGKFKAGEVLHGTYTGTDKHAGSITLEVTPVGPANGAQPVITQMNGGAPPPMTTSSLSYANGLPGSGATGLWDLDTTPMKPCGYNVRIIVTDRTIVNSGGNHWQAADIEGFCVE